MTTSKQQALRHLSRSCTTLQIAGHDHGASHLLLQELERGLASRVVEARNHGADEQEVDRAIMAGVNRAQALRARAIAA